MEEVKTQIARFTDWDATKKGKAIYCLKGLDSDLVTGLPDEELKALLDRELSTEEDLPALQVQLTPYTWAGNKASTVEVKKGSRWLEKYICPPGTIVIPVQNQAWLHADFLGDDASVTASKTDFLICLDVPEVRALLNTTPTPEQLIGILQYIIGAYEAKTSTFIRDRGLLGVWPQAVLEALAINYMANRRNGAFFIPVFGGDFNQHLVVHAAPTQNDFMLHAAKLADSGGSSVLAVRYMQYLLLQTKQAAQAALQGDAGPSAGESGPSEETRQGSAQVYQLIGRGTKRRREAEEALNEAEDEEEDAAVDADSAMQAVENAYHVNLIELLRHPRMYSALGLSGPPQRIQHASLEERLSTWQVVHSAICTDAR